MDKIKSETEYEDTYKDVRFGYWENLRRCDYCHHKVLIRGENEDVLDDIYDPQIRKRLSRRMISKKEY